MRFLVQMEIVDSGRSATAQEGVAFIEQLVLPTLEALEAHRAAGTVVAGGPLVGRIALALVIEAESTAALDVLIESLPLWPRMSTTVAPLITFEDRAAAVRARLEGMRARIQGAAARDRS